MRASASAVACGISLVGRWVPSERSCADEPSRVFEKYSKNTIDDHTSHLHILKDSRLLPPYRIKQSSESQVGGVNTQTPPANSHEEEGESPHIGEESEGKSALPTGCLAVDLPVTFLRPKINAIVKKEGPRGGPNGHLEPKLSSSKRKQGGQQKAVPSGGPPGHLTPEPIAGKRSKGGQQGAETHTLSSGATDVHPTETTTKTFNDSQTRYEH